MKNIFSKKQVGLAAACALALCAMSAATAQNMPYSSAADHSMLRDGRGQQVMSQFGLCWHTGQGPRPESTAQCDPNYRAPAPVAQFVVTPPPYVAPPMASPAPATPAPLAAPAPAEHPAPVVVAAAAPVQHEKFAFDANVLFDFDKSELRPAGREALDAFVRQVKGIDATTINAVGYADRLGTEAYNQSLSERRVATVKEYLVSQGIDSRWVSSTARGASQPVTQAGQCAGAASERTIACLQPDRHVSVEISGTRARQ